MSDTLRFLRETGDSSSTAAQSFLNKKLAQNKYSATPDIDYNKGILDKDIEAHNASVADPYALGEGTVATGPAYPKSGGSSGGGVKGSMDADQVRKEFGLTYEGEKEYDGGTHEGRLQNEDGDIWYKDQSGAIKYLGNMGKFERGRVGQGSNKDSESKSDKSRFHKGDPEEGAEGSDQERFKSSNDLLQKAHEARNKEVNDDNGFNSINDVGHAMRYLMDKSGGGQDQGRKPIKHSPEIRQAKSRIKQYEERVMSGELSNSIFGNANAAAGGAEDYRFEATEGLDGIGTEGGAAKADKSATSTASFLDKKKQDVKIDYNFRPAS